MTTWDPPLTKGEAQARALHVLSLEENDGMPLEEAIRHGDAFIDVCRATKFEPPFYENPADAPKPGPYDKRWR